MSVVLNGTTQYLDLLNIGHLINAGGLFPCSLYCCMKTEDLTQTSALASLDSGLTDMNIAQFRGSVAGDYVAAACYDGAWQLAVSTAGVSSATWHHVLVVFTSTTSRTVYIDGGNKHLDTNTCNSGPGAGGDLGVGCRVPGGTPSLFFGGKLAELAIWGKALSDANAVSLAEGDLANTVEVSDLLWYFNLYGDANNDGGTQSDNLTARNAPTFDTDDHPVDAPGADYLDVAGSSVIAFTSEGAVAAYKDSTGSSTIAFTIEAAAHVDKASAGTISIAFTSSGILTFGPLSGTKSEKYRTRLILIGADAFWYEDN